LGLALPIVRRSLGQSCALKQEGRFGRAQWVEMVVGRGEIKVKGSRSLSQRRILTRLVSAVMVIALVSQSQSHLAQHELALEKMRAKVHNKDVEFTAGSNLAFCRVY